jgi:hypothetical protein
MVPTAVAKSFFFYTLTLTLSPQGEREIKEGTFGN